MILVTNESFSEVVAQLNKSELLSCDTETTGLYPYKRDRLFSIQFSDASEDYYFNFQEYETGEAVLPFSHIILLQRLFDKKTIFIQNAKFDMAFLYKEGIRFDKCDVHDTEVAGRIIRNDHLKYSLDEQAKRELGAAKDDAVMEYLKKHKLFTAETVPGKDTVYKAFHFDEVPANLIMPYGCKDTRLTYDLGVKQIGQIEELSKDIEPGKPSIKTLHEMEKKLIHACFEIERVGVRIDKEFCNEAIEFETKRIRQAEKIFQETVGGELTDSGQCLGPIFEQLGFPPGRTATGEHEITDVFLSSVSHPLGSIIQEYRDARKRANTYFKSYLHFADANGDIHANMKQAGTKTGRFSYMDPNLQNIPSDDPDADEVDNSPYPIRRAFVPREGYFFLSIDYKQMEFRMMLDEAGQHDLIAKINAGHDPHDATAELTGLKRKPAKTLNFGLLYGMGIVKLALSIMQLTPDQKKYLKMYDALPDKRNTTLMPVGSMEIVTPILQEMKRFKAQYFAALPMVENFILQCSGAVKIRHERSPGNGWLKTWFGRRAYFSDPAWAYKAANAKIQGGCADVVKLAMIKLHNFLKDKKSRMVVQVHDEILFEISFDEMHILEEIMKIMETAYPHQFIPLTCSMSASLESFYDVVDGDPREWIGKEKRNGFQGENLPLSSGASEHVG